MPSALDWRGLLWLLLLAGLSYALALLGFLAPRRRWRGWVRAVERRVGWLEACDRAERPRAADNPTLVIKDA